MNWQCLICEEEVEEEQEFIQLRLDSGEERVVHLEPCGWLLDMVQ